MTPRQRLIEILNSNEFAPPIIVFVNQKRSADQLARDINRAKVSPFARIDVCVSLRY